MAIPSLLAVTSSGDRLELRPAGSWIAANASLLRALYSSVEVQLAEAKRVKVDLTAIRELDRWGGWLVEKMARRAILVGLPAGRAGAANDHISLTDDMPAEDFVY